MLNIQINGVPVQCRDGITVLQACTEAGETIPSFCYHDRLNIAGNCRICLVQFEGMGKLIESCTVQVRDGLKVFTSTPFIKKARENVMEMLLFNHPLDCAICDQAGECDLQEQSRHFGSDRGRAYENRRGVLDKNCGPLIKTIMTRCIHCTRCVRFSEEIANKPFFGTLKRGTNTEIAPYKSNKIFDSNISGNVIDLCPVGALTAKPYAFTSRPWEESTYKFESFDLFDSSFPRANLSFSETKVLSITPKTDNLRNKEWISDYFRFCTDGLNLVESLSYLNKYRINKKDLVSSHLNKLASPENKVNLNLFFFNEYNIDIRFYLLLNLNYRLQEDEILCSKFLKNKNIVYKNLFKSSFYSLGDFRKNYSCFIDLKKLKKSKNIFIFNMPLEDYFPIYFTYLNIYKRIYNTKILSFGFNNNFNSIGLNTKDLILFFRGKNFFSGQFLKKFSNSDFFYGLFNKDLFHLLNYQFKYFLMLHQGNSLRLNNLNIFSNFFVKNEFFYKSFFRDLVNSSYLNISSIYKNVFLSREVSYKFFSFANHKQTLFANLYIQGDIKNDNFISLNLLNNVESQYFDSIFPVNDFFRTKQVQSINIFGQFSSSKSLSNIGEQSSFSENFYLYSIARSFNNFNTDTVYSFNKDTLSTGSLDTSFYICSKMLSNFSNGFYKNSYFFDNFNKKLESNFILDSSSSLKFLNKKTENF